MQIDSEQIKKWLESDEDEHLEFKAAKDSYSRDDTIKYCCALANETGGKFVLGITDKKPRKVVGSNAFKNIDKIKQKLIASLGLRIEIYEYDYDGKRVLVFDVPSRPIGVPKKYKDTYWMRRGESLVAMTEDLLKKIFDEGVPDFSAQICKGASIDDLSAEAVEEFRKRWIRKSGNKSLSQLSIQQLLLDAELVYDEGVTYAAMALFGKRRTLGKFLAQAEVIFEYRSKEAAGPANQRIEFREGFFLYYEKLWETINLRNDIQHFQDGLFMRDIPTFSEGSIREAILNAVSHRDYQNPGSVFIRQFPERIEITSPGGLPSGVTAENIIDRQMPRNRRIAEAFSKCGLVERSGQGANRMFEEAIEQSKSLPDFGKTDEYQVCLLLNGQVKDIEFLKFLEKVSNSRSKSFSTYELLVLDAIHKGEKPMNHLRPTMQALVNEGIVESVSRGKYILNKKYYVIAGEKGTYTRRKGLDRETNRQLLLKHISDNSEQGSPMKELMQVLPSLSRRQVQILVNSLAKEKLIYKTGKTRSSLWFYKE